MNFNKLIVVSLIMLLAGSAIAQAQGEQSSSKSTPPAKTVKYKRLGMKPDASVPVVKLEEVIKNPMDYDGEFVVLEGTYGGACGDGDYFFKDKFDMVEFDFALGSRIERLKIGTPIRLYGKVKVRAHREEEKEEAEKEREATIAIDGKGVEYR